ncbi:hypothetical protein SAMN06297280_2360 [Arsukibacterium tuosuense]|uniref:Uncharacterized protein n=1 Tax=Arsukibacterium tuosuense TaxID=1323745 RepID=A0A285IZQ9_9GAMM|nr:hypothetical protein [Arsukibacterium tuosuense]SNY53303.1 hypothetical protein SAMN06297280_2360 [Arsukibacterium tuosuense]
MDQFTIKGLSLSLLLLAGVCQTQQAQAQQAEPDAPARQAGPAMPENMAAMRQPAATVQVDISTTISGNQEQPRTLYVLPWQDSIAQIRIPAPEINPAPEPLKPLDRQQFLRFIEAQSLNQQPVATASSKNN